MNQREAIVIKAEKDPREDIFRPSTVEEFIEVELVVHGENSTRSHSVSGTKTELEKFVD